MRKEDTAPPRKGDVLSWRGQTYTVKRVFKWRIHLEGLSAKHDIRVSCLKPIAEGGFSEAIVVRRTAC